MNKYFLLSFALIVFLSSCGSQESNHEEQPTSASSVSEQTPESQPKQLIATPLAETQDNTTLYFNAVVYSGVLGDSSKSAFAIKDGKFVGVGSLEELDTRFPYAKKVDLDGNTVVPGFIDAHGHLLGLGQSLLNVDLRGTNSVEEIVLRLEERSSSLGEEDWLIGRGWDQNDWADKSLPTRQDLDKAFKTRPVILERIDGHATWVNSAALSLAERNLDGDWQIDGGEIIRDADNKATGILIDNASSLISSLVPEPSTQQLTQALKLGIRKASSVGLTSMHDAGTSLKVWKLLREMNSEKEIDLRVYAMADGANQMLDFLCEQGPIVDGDLLQARSIKLYSDGALGSRGAALIEEYSDDPGNFGLLIEPVEALVQHASKAMKCGLQVNIHAIGDRGNRLTLDVLEQASSGIENPGRHRIEHAQVIHEEDFERFRSLGIIASVQPTHATSDMYWAEDRVGKIRVKGAYAWQTLLNKGIPVALGSDFPVEKPDPLLGFYAAITRQDASSWPEDGWYPDQRLSREEALYGFTIGAAFAAFQEDSIGSIETGKLADFVVLSNDIMSVPVEEILETIIVSTYLRGQEVYQMPQ